jgi:hypothetical protein
MDDEDEFMDEDEFLEEEEGEQQAQSATFGSCSAHA